MDNLKNIYICFPEGKHKALTMSFDDGRQEDYRLVKLFNQYGIKGTFNVNSGLRTKGRIDQKEYPELYRGHEIACHTVTHPTISRSPLDQTARQILEDRCALEALAGYPVRGMAYPNGSYSRSIMELLPALGIRYARTIQDTNGFSMPQDFMEWHPTCHFRHGMLELGRQFTELCKKQYLYLMYVWGHSYELPEENGWEQMEEFCRLMSGRKDVWFASNIEIVDYMEAASRLQFTAAGDLVYNPSFISCWVSVDDTICEVPGGTTRKIG